MNFFHKFLKLFKRKYKVTFEHVSQKLVKDIAVWAEQNDVYYKTTQYLYFPSQKNGFELVDSKQYGYKGITFIFYDEKDLMFFILIWKDKLDNTSIYYKELLSRIKKYGI